MAAILQSVIVPVFTKESATQHIEMFFFSRVAVRKIGSVERVFFLMTAGYVMHQQFNIQHLHVLPTFYMFCVYPRTNSDLCHLQHKLIGFCNRDEKCLLRGTDWVFK